MSARTLGAIWAPLLRPAALLVGLLFALGALGVFLIEAHRQRTLAEALLQQERLAIGGVRTAAQLVERTLDLTRTVHAVASLARNYHLNGQAQNAPPMEAILVELAREERASILQIAMIDSGGQLVFSTVPGWQPMDLSDREHFRVHRDGLREPFISTPLVGRASNRWSVQVTRAILGDRDGEFAGVVVVSVDPLEISAALQQGHFGVEAVTTLTRHDGLILARSHEPERTLGQRISDSARTIFASRTEGAAGMRSPFTADDMTVAWRALANWPLVVANGLPRGPLHADANQTAAELRMRLAMALGVLGALAASALLWRSRRQAAAAAASAEALHREMADLVAALPGAAYRGLARAEGRLTLTQATEGLARLTGRPMQDAPAAMDWDHLLDQEGRKARATLVATAIAGQESVGEYRLRHADGHWIWVRDHARTRRPVRTGEVEVVGVLSDITREREMAAQAANSAKLATLGEMATGLAHELNQPASAIALAADLAVIEMRSGDPTRVARAQQRLETIVQQIMRMQQIVEHFQIFSRGDTHNDELAAISLEDALAGALGLMHGTLNASGVRVSVNLPADLPRVIGQLVPLEQVLVNLLLNARDAMEATPPAQREVHIAAQSDMAAGEVRLRVADTGPGFTPEQLARALEPFYTTKPPGKGTGLGLSIVYGTLRAFGGGITTGNCPGGGAELTLHLRAATQDHRPARGPREPLRNTATT